MKSSFGDGIITSRESIVLPQESELLIDSSLVIFPRIECVALCSGYKADSPILFPFPTLNKDDQQKTTSYDSNNTHHNTSYCTTWYVEKYRLMFLCLQFLVLFL